MAELDWLGKLQPAGAGIAGGRRKQPPPGRSERGRRRATLFPRLGQGRNARWKPTSIAWQGRQETCRPQPMAHSAVAVLVASPLRPTGCTQCREMAPGPSGEALRATLAWLTRLTCSAS